MNRSTQNGSIMVVMVLLLPAIILVVGFSVDIAHIQRVRTELSTATDLAAKAAADGLSLTQNQTTARNLAIQVAAQNYVAGVPLTLNPNDVEFGRSERQVDDTWDFTPGAEPANAVRVTGSRQSTSADGAVPAYFGLFYGHPEYEPEFEAIAAFLDVDICLVLDRSSSMKLDVSDPATGMGSSHPNYCLVPQPASRWVALDQAVDVFLNDLGLSIGIEHVSIVTFASDNTSVCGETNLKVSMDQDLTSDLSLVQSAIDTRTTTVWNGSTDIEAGVNLARQVLNGPSARTMAEKRIILFSDGTYTAADPTPEIVLAATSDNIIVHTISFGAGANQSDMASFAASGNGKHYHADTAADLNAVFRELAASISVVVN